MRIACVHVPQFALQCVTRVDASLRGAAVAVVGAGHAGRVIVQACSRAAWALGVRVGMTATAARATSPELRVIAADAQLERETMRALADAMLGVASGVDLGGRVGAAGAHLAMYCEVPTKTRGTSFGDRLLERLATLGVTGRIGIADDRFTAWVAASCSDDDSSVTSVPRGGSAAFLAPRPLSLLAITPEVQHMLEALGVRTLGEFASLPAPSVARPFDADYQALARGEGGSGIRPYAPDAPIREELAIQATGRGFVLTADNAPSVPTGADAIALVAERIALRLAGRGRAAVRLEIASTGPSGERVITSEVGLLETGSDVGAAIARALGDELPSVWRLRVAVIGEGIGDATPAVAEIRPSATAPGVADAPVEAILIGALEVVLSNPGVAWRLTSPAAPIVLSSSAERRYAHRRTQRGKPHRRASRDPVTQARLFK